MRQTLLLDAVQDAGSAPGAADRTGAPPADRRGVARTAGAPMPCRTHDPELWFAEQTVRVEQAKALCRQCPLIGPCLAGALARQEPWGVWGGEVFVGGVVVATKRGRGRPRKDRSAA